MTETLLDSLAEYLEQRGHGARNVTLFVGNLPASPDSVIVLRDYAGSPPQYKQDSVLPAWEMPRFQMLIRDPGYAGARQKARSVWEALHISNTLMNGVLLISSRPLQAPFGLGKDENGREQYVANFECRVT